uniref:NADH-ubiquinone oxidoreductase chain 1 n=1 Tax=Acavomonas peruviana TaxID=1542312 RepID=V5KV66_9ALVE|nr:NADH dehydrogenase subunit 1 [Acavomonas peruviana]AHA41674.1 NADH dehydrogenase subunit 1 [Acavomonas peruviana]
MVYIVKIVVFKVLFLISVLVPLLLSVAFFTLSERKVLSFMQRRKGPNIVGYLGLLQPIADGVKLFLTENVLGKNINILFFCFSPMFVFMLSLLSWSFVPLSLNSVGVDNNFGFFYIYIISSFSIYGIFIAGWSSNSKYSFLGSVRSTAQMISYELPMGFVLAILALPVGSLNMSTIVLLQQWVWFFIPYLPIFIVFVICFLAETNRPPFDLPEAEGELVAGYFVEYSSIIFALFFLAEYANMVLMSILTVILFFGGWLIIPIGFKIFFFVYFFIWIRATVPRYRYDSLMGIGWKSLIPFCMGFFLFELGFLISFNSLPPPGGFIFIK